MNALRRGAAAIMVVAGLAIAGVGLGTLLAPSLEAQSSCHNDACNFDVGNCHNSDVKYNCEETSGPLGCTSHACAET